MQFSFLALFALPVTLALPQVGSPTPSQACACANAAGQTRVYGFCQYQVGQITTIDGQEYCFPATTYTRPMAEVFSTSLCPQQFGADYNRSVCKNVNVCSTGFGSQLQLC